MYRRGNSPPPLENSAPPSYSNLPQYDDDAATTPLTDTHDGVRLLTHMDDGQNAGYTETNPAFMLPPPDAGPSNMRPSPLRTSERPSYNTATDSFVSENYASSYGPSSVDPVRPEPLRSDTATLGTGRREDNRPYVTKPLPVYVSRKSQDVEGEEDRERMGKTVGWKDDNDRSSRYRGEERGARRLSELGSKSDQGGDKSPGARRDMEPKAKSPQVSPQRTQMIKLQYRDELKRKEKEREREKEQSKAKSPAALQSGPGWAVSRRDKYGFAVPSSPRKLPVHTSHSSFRASADKPYLPHIAASEPLAIDFSSILPSIPDGPSRRQSLRKSYRKQPLIFNESLQGRNSHDTRPAGPSQRSYQPTVRTQQHPRETSFVGDAPILAPESAYDPFNAGRQSPSRARGYSPTRAGSDIGRPPSITQYEPSEINGRKRPGSISGSSYSGLGGNQRPLPMQPAPLFSRQGGRSTSATIDIPLDGADAFSDMRQRHTPNRQGMKSRQSYNSDETYTEVREDDMDDDEKSNLDLYGPAPEGRQERRGARQAQRTKKEVRLINGELILECKIPTILYSFLPRRDDIEFTHMRYTAVTCDPDHFVERGYKLRQQFGSNQRETELFICVTMYNEDEINFTRTMHAVMKNIAHFCSRSKSRTWGENGWQKIVVCIVSDGRTKIHPRTLDALAAMGVYQDGIAKNLVNGKEVQAHVYEYTTQVSLDSDLKFKGAEKGIVPVQMIFCLKERNAKKLNSHRWFFNAFGRALVPNICILLDVGTKPTGNSLYHLWKAFDTDSNVAGACGEIVAMKGKAWLGLLNPLVASQNFEYKMSNILDKPLESVFGYITVLPGALSAYRYHALQNDSTGHGPLSQYFKGETLHGQNADVFTANMYLAEDRILCWELVAKRDERWVLKYVKNCKGETDVPDSVPEFVSQRRRWLNGAFFAAVYSLVHFKQIWKTDHTLTRKILLHIEFIYQFLSLIFTFLSLANFYLTFYFVAGSLADPQIDPFGHNMGKYIFYFLKYICVLLICTQFILSMGNRPQGAKKLYFSSMVIYSVIMIYTTFATIYIVVRQFTKSEDPDAQLGNNIFTNLAVSLASTIGLYFFSSFLYLDPWHMFTSSAQYFALLPSYICTLQIYAFCNTHDISWGTKGDNTISTDLGTATSKSGNTVLVDMPSEQLDIDSGYDEALRNLRDRIEVPEPLVGEATLQEDYYRAVRTYMVVCWMVANAILAMSVSEAYAGTDVGSNWYLKVLLWSVAAIALFRAIGSTVFRIIEGIGKAVEAKAKYESGQLGFGGGGGGSKSSTVVSASKLANQSLWDRMKGMGETIVDKCSDVKRRFRKS